MPQTTPWEKEYRNPKLVTKEDAPQTSVKEFLKFLRKEEGIEVIGKRILDLGCGTGRNSNFLAGMENVVIGFEISKTALDLAMARAKEKGLHAGYQLQSIGEKFPLLPNSIDIALDVMSSNSLTEAERKIYLEEARRVLKLGGYFFVKALCKDGDKNAKNLLKLSPGKEYDTYIIKEMNLAERVFSEEDFRALYGAYFEILELFKKTNYARFQGRVYKRNYLVAYLRKK